MQPRTGTMLLNFWQMLLRRPPGVTIVTRHASHLTVRNRSLEYVFQDSGKVLVGAAGMLKLMRFPGLHAALSLLSLAIPLLSANLVPCGEGARQYLPCELSFDLQPNELASPTAAFTDDLLSVEFRSPSHTTYLMHEFWDGNRTLRIRFTPTEPGGWIYKISSSLQRYENQEKTFNVAENTNAAGLVNVANLRHWRTTNKKPHLWLAAEAPFHDIDETTLDSWLNARQHDGFTHVRGVVLTSQGANKAFGSDLQPNIPYFKALDDKILAVANRGLTLDLIIADLSFVRSGAFDRRERVDALIRYVVARYGGLNVTWQGIQHFEDVPGSRSLLRDIGELLKRYDSFRHPRSSDAADTSSALLNDGWMNYIVEASARPELAAVEHQFTNRPQVHVITTTEPDVFRHELWNATTNGEYPSVSYASLQNEANVKAIQAWFKVVSETRHWELEPYFEVDGARAVGLDEVEYLAYAEKPGIVEINLPKHKYNPVWINPATGEEIPLKDYRGEVFSRDTPDKTHDWVLQVPREGHKEAMARSYYFESQDPPEQEVESDSAKIPYEISDPPGDSMSVRIPTPYKVKLIRTVRATRNMQYVWWGEVVAGGEGTRVLAIGASGNFTLPKALALPGSPLNLRVLAINANGKAYELNKVYTLTP